jgi:hypothetical protein
MSKYLATSPRLEGEADTVEGRLADYLEHAEVVVDDYHLSNADRAKVVFALRLAGKHEGAGMNGIDDQVSKEKALASAVKDAVVGLNEAIRRAAEVGLTVEVDHHDIQIVGLSSPWPVLNATVKRVHVTRY